MREPLEAPFCISHYFSTTEDMGPHSRILSIMLKPPVSASAACAGEVTCAFLPVDFRERICCFKSHSSRF
jgi:hypothetical protein